MSAQNKAIVRRVFDEVWVKGNMAVVDELIAPNHVDHRAMPGMPPGREGVKQLVSMYRGAFPDFRATIEDQLAEGDKVVTRWSAQGTHRGALMGIPATGKQVKFSGITINRIVGGKVSESWASVDQLGIMQQLGLVPSPGQGR
jgi:steroid delta-isomerase-like uncharacterized protein